MPKAQVRFSNPTSSVVVVRSLTFHIFDISCEVAGLILTKIRMHDSQESGQGHLSCANWGLKGTRRGAKTGKIKPNFKISSFETKMPRA